MKAIISLLFISTCTFAQFDYTTIDEQSKSIPDSLQNHAKIAAHLTKDLTTDREKARAIYSWIAQNVEYDTELYYSSDRMYQSSKEIVSETLTNRKGVCLHYSELFLAMTQAIGLQSSMIGGYTRDVFGDISKRGHAWNSLQIDSNYYLIDVTWSAGYLKGHKYIHKFHDDYFLIKPKDFIKDHIPLDPIWQFLDNPITHQDFAEQDFSKLGQKGNFHFRDSIKQYRKQAEIAQLEAENRRIKQYGGTNAAVKRHLDDRLLQNTKNIYNIGVKTFNHGIEVYNTYVAHRNKRFLNPKLKDSQIRELIDTAEKKIYTAKQILDTVSTKDKEVNDLLTDVKANLFELLPHLESEIDFVDKYLNTWKPFRYFIF